MKKMVFCFMVGMFAGALCAQTSGDIVRLDRSKAWGGAVDGTQNGLGVNVPGANWVWGSGFDWATPAFGENWEGGSDYYSELLLYTGAEGASLAVPIVSVNAYEKPETLRFAARILPSGRAGIGFWDEMQMPGSLDSYIGFSGLILNRPDQLVEFYENGVKVDETAVNVPYVWFDVELAVNTSDGSITSIVVDGVEVTAFSSAAFTDEATMFAGFITLGNYQEGSRLSIAEFAVSSPELVVPPQVATEGVENVAVDSATVLGTLITTGTEPFAVSLCWGTADGVADTNRWETQTPLPLVTEEGAFDFELTGLDGNTTYYFRFHVVDADGKEAWSGTTFEFLTLGRPELGEVGYTLHPEETVFTVDVVKVGATPTLYFSWSTNNNGVGQWDNVVTRQNPGEGVHAFVLSNLADRVTLYYNVELVTPLYGTDEKSGSVLIAYSNIWTGEAGDDLWRNAGNWSLGFVPQNAGDIAVVEPGAATISLAGLGDVTLGLLNIIPPHYGTSVIRADDDTARIVFDNALMPPKIGGNVHEYGTFNIDTPVHFATETRVEMDTTALRLCFYGELSGEGLVIEKGRIAFVADEGQTKTVTIPISAADGATYEDVYIHKFGAGDVIFQGGVQTFPLAADWADNTESIKDGGRLIFDAVIYTNSNAAGRRNLFGDRQNALIVRNGAKYIETSGNNTQFYCPSNLVAVVGQDSEIQLAKLKLDSYHNIFRVEDGAYAELTHADIDYIDKDGNKGRTNDVWVGSAIANTPSMLNLYGRTITVNGYACRLTAAPGGVITNGTIQIGSASTTNNVLSLAGGRVYCVTLNVHPENALEIAVGATEIQPVEAQNITFSEGATVHVNNPQQLPGRFIIARAQNSIVGLDTLALDAPANMRCSLKFLDDDTTIVLTCATSETVLIVR